jgi:hypothetical protein
MYVSIKYKVKIDSEGASVILLSTICIYRYTSKIPLSGFNSTGERAPIVGDGELFWSFQLSGSSELNWNHLQWKLTIQQLESTTPNHRRRPSTIKLLAPVTVDISVSVVDSSCWIVNIYCRWFKFSSEEPVLTEISTVTGAIFQSAWAILS